jgi:hypothetical protein
VAACVGWSPWDQHPDAVGDDALHLVLVPVAGIGEHDLRALGDPGGVKLTRSTTQPIRTQLRAA